MLGIIIHQETPNLVNRVLAVLILKPCSQLLVGYEGRVAGKTHCKDITLINYLGDPNTPTPFYYHHIKILNDISKRRPVSLTGPLE